MTTPSKEQSLERLIERVRAATGPDQVLDLDISLHFRGLRNVGGYWAEEIETGKRVKINYASEPVTASIDAALALVERELPEHDWILGHTNGGMTIHCQLGPDAGKMRFGETPALAILAALLSSLKEHSNDHE